MSGVEGVLRALEELGPKGVERFAASIDPAWVEEALAASGAISIRRRRMPAEQVVWLVLGMALFEDRSIHDVVTHLGLAVGPGRLAASAVPKARARVGSEPLRWLFHRTSEAWSESPGLGGYRDLAVYAIDGTHLRVQDTDDAHVNP